MVYIVTKQVSVTIEENVQNLKSANVLQKQQEITVNHVFPDTEAKAVPLSSKTNSISLLVWQSASHHQSLSSQY
jgi:hypothetical protein